MMLFRLFTCTDTVFVNWFEGAVSSSRDMFLDDNFITTFPFGFSWALAEVRGLYNMS